MLLLCVVGRPQEKVITELQKPVSGDTLTSKKELLSSTLEFKYWRMGEQRKKGMGPNSKCRAGNVFCQEETLSGI